MSVLLEVRLRARARAYVVGSSVVCVSVCVMPVLLEVRLKARARLYVVGSSLVCVCVCT
jgi:hypothetical protein